MFPPYRNQSTDFQCKSIDLCCYVENKSWHLRKTFGSIKKFQTISSQFSHQIETSQLIYIEDQLVGFFFMENGSVMG